jgi:hypothetical protein
MLRGVGLDTWQMSRAAPGSDYRAIACMRSSPSRGMGYEPGMTEDHLWQAMCHHALLPVWSKTMQAIGQKRYERL